MVIFWWCFFSARPKELLREEKGWLTDVGQNSWWHMKRAQHAAHNPKFDKMGLFRHPPWWYGKDLPTKLPMRYGKTSENFEYQLCCLPVAVLGHSCAHSQYCCQFLHNSSPPSTVYDSLLIKPEAYHTHDFSCTILMQYKFPFALTQNMRFIKCYKILHMSWQYSCLMTCRKL